MQLGREASGTTGNVLPWPVLAASPLLLTFRSVCITPRSDTGRCQQQTCPAVGGGLCLTVLSFSPLPQFIVECHGNTLLPQFLGMYRLTVDGVETYMVVTRNVFSHRLTVHRKYDLKVSVWGQSQKGGLLFWVGKSWLF